MAQIEKRIMDDFKKKISETHRKARIMGVCGAGIGGGIGGYISSLKGNFIYAGIGGGAGFLIGYVIGMLTRIKTDLLRKKG